jgi:hypothetical protein
MGEYEICQEMYISQYNLGKKSATAHVVSCRLPTAPARVRARVKSYGIMMDRVALGQILSEHSGFPCHSFIPISASQSSSIIQNWYNRTINDHSNKGLRSTPPPSRNKHNINSQKILNNIQ